MRAPDLQGGTAARERYIFDTVGVPPTNSASIPQAQVEPGIPQPAATNVDGNGVVCGLRGQLRQSATTDPTVIIKIEDLGSIPSLDPNAIVQSALLAPGGPDVAQILANVQRRPRSVVPTPRFSVRRSNYDPVPGGDAAQVGVRDTWARWPTASSVLSAVPPTGTSTWQVRGAASFCEAADGSLLVGYAVGRVDLSAFGFIVARYAPWVSHVFTTVVNCSTATLGTFLGSASFIPQDCQLVRRGDDVYALICGQVGIGGGTSLLAVVQLFSPHNNNAAMRKIALPTVLGTAAPVRIGATVTPDGACVVAMQSSSSQIHMAVSPDMRTWTQYTGTSAIVQLGDPKVIDGPAAGNSTGVVLDISMHSSTEGWAVTDLAEILQTRDAGRTWERQESPAEASYNFKGRPIKLWSVAASASLQIAVGDGGLVLRRMSPDYVWQVIRYPAETPAAVFAGAYIDTTAITTVDIPAVALRKVRMVGTRAWIVGGDAIVLYCANIAAAAPTFTAIHRLGNGGTYYDFVVDSQGSNNTLIAVGDAATHNDGSVGTAAERKRRVSLFADADTPSTPKYLHEQADTADSEFMVSVTAEGTTAFNVDGARGYMLSGRGRVFRWDGQTSGNTLTFTQIADLRWKNLHWHADIHTFAAGKVRVVSPDSPLDPAGGAVFACDNAGSGSPTFTAQALPRRGTVVHSIDADTTIIGTVRGFVRLGVAQSSRKIGNLLTLSDGSAILMCAYNGTRRQFEVYRAPRPLPDQIPAFSLSYVASHATDQRPCLAELDDGTVLMSYGQSHIFGLDGGTRWLAQDSPLLPIPLADLASGSGFTLTDGSILGARSIRSYRGGRLFSAVPRERGAGDMDAIGIFTAWEFDAAGAYYRPLIPGKPQDIGVDGLLVTFSGDPIPGNTWTVAPQYAYGARNIVLESPSASEWRSKDYVTPVTIEWDRQHADVVAVLGAGRFWNVSAFALFRTNFRSCKFSISDPLNDASFTEFTLDQSIAAGNGTPPGGSIGATATSIVVDTSKSWTPGRFNRGTRQYYVRFTGIGFGETYRIIRSGSNWFEIEGAVTIDTVGKQPYVIFGDRFAWFGEGGSGPGSGGLRDSNRYRFGRYIRVTIAAEVTADGFFRIGRSLIGLEPPPDAAGRSFGYGMQYRLVPTAIEERGVSGISSVRHLGRTGQVWTMTYRGETVDARDRKMAETVERMRRSFGIAWIGSDHDSIELVRLVDAQSVANSLKANRFDSEWALQEVA